MNWPDSKTKMLRYFWGMIPWVVVALMVLFIVTLGGRIKEQKIRLAEAKKAAMKKEVPDLVLLDVGLPGMDGIAALKEIKRSHTAMPVIMITAYEDIDTVVSAMKLGAYDYIVKPIHMDELSWMTATTALDSPGSRLTTHWLSWNMTELLHWPNRRSRPPTSWTRPRHG